MCVPVPWLCYGNAWEAPLQLCTGTSNNPVGRQTCRLLSEAVWQAESCVATRDREASREHQHTCTNADVGRWLVDQYSQVRRIMLVLSLLTQNLKPAYHLIRITYRKAQFSLLKLCPSKYPNKMEKGLRGDCRYGILELRHLYLDTFSVSVVKARLHVPQI